MPKNKTTNNLDKLSFGEAFRESRNALGAGSVFKWRGSRYTTNFKSEEDRTKAVQDQVVKASNEKTTIEGPDQIKKTNSALDLQESIVNTDDANPNVLRNTNALDQVKHIKDGETSWFKGEEGVIPDEIEGFFKKSVNFGQDLINKAGELIDFDNDLVEKTLDGGKKGYNKAKEILSEVSDDLHEVADDTIENAKIRSRNIKNKVNELTNTVQESAESELDKFNKKLDDNFLNKTLLPFIQKHVPWGDVDENTKKVIENPRSTTETLTDEDKTNLFKMFTEKVTPKVNEIGNSINNYLGQAGDFIKEGVEKRFSQPIPGLRGTRNEGETKREWLNDEFNPFIRDKMFGVLPMPIRQLLVQRANISQDNMTEQEKLGLYMAYKNAVSRGDDMVKYKDYGSDRNLWKQFQGGNESLIDAGKHYMQASDTDKGAYNMMMTIGGEHFREEDGNIIFDQGFYDFNKRENTYDPNEDIGLYGKLRNFMGTTGGVTETDPTRANINISLNKQEMEAQLRQMEEANAAQAHDGAPFIYQNIPQNIIPLLLKGNKFMGMQQMRKGGVRPKGPIKNK